MVKQKFHIISYYVINSFNLYLFSKTFTFYTYEDFYIQVKLNFKYYINFEVKL